MKKIKFYKYHGTGNDFIMIDNRLQQVDFTSHETIAKLCHRRFGIGADGIILLEGSGTCDFVMKYYNSDGNEGSMCGNGGRCIVAFAHNLGIIESKTTFEAIDGLHEARIMGFNDNIHTVSLQMKDVNKVARDNDAYVLDTGSPHFVVFCKNTDLIDVVAEGRKIRYNDRYKNSGINVNFISEKGSYFSIRTYERGVEDETYSCGTGTVAAAIAIASAGLREADSPIRFESKGGLLEVEFKQNGFSYTNIRLNGPATQVFEGSLLLNQTYDNR